MIDPSRISDSRLKWISESPCLFPDFLSVTHTMTAKIDEPLIEIFKKYQNIAVLGMSRNMQKSSNWIPVYLSTKSYRIIPINPKAGRIKGWKSYPDLRDVAGRIDILQVFRPPGEALDIVKAAIERKQKRGDITVIWLQEGSNDEARKLAESEGIIFIQGRCMYREYKRLMLKT